MKTSTEKPKMSRHEASWHEHLAGLRAGDAAAANGAQDQEDALGDATAGYRTIGPFQIRPVTEGLRWTLRRMAREFATYAEENNLPVAAEGEYLGERELLELALSTLVFTDARRVWRTLGAGGISQLVAEADVMAWEMPLEIWRELDQEFAGAMQVIMGLAPSQTAAGAEVKKNLAEGSGT